MTKSKMSKITITDDRFGRTAGVGVNGRQHNIPVGQEVEVDEGIVDVLRNSGVAFTVSGDDSGVDSAITAMREDAPLSGGPKVELGKVKKGDEPEPDQFRVSGEIGSVGAGANAGDGSEGAASSHTADGGITQDTGGASAPEPGSRDTPATTEQTGSARRRRSTKK